MKTVNTNEAKIYFAKLVNQALKGEEVIITRGGKPLLRLMPYTKISQQRKGGQLRGMITIADDFDAPLSEDVLKTF